MYATTASYNSTAPYSGRVIRDSYYSPSYSRSSSFDGTLTGRMYGGSNSYGASVSRPIGPSSEERPLRISSGSYGESGGGSIFASTTIGSGSHFGRLSAKPPLPQSYSSHGSPYANSGYRASDYAFTESLRYPRSSSVDRGGSPMAYIPIDSRTRWEDELRTVPGQVHHIAARFERLNSSRQRLDSFGNSPLIERRGFREQPTPSGVINGYSRNNEDLTIRGRSYGRSPTSRQRQSSGSSEDSSSESRDALGALPTNGYKLYRSQVGATSMPDVPAYAESNAKQAETSENRLKPDLVRNEPARNSSSSLESLESQSGQSSSSAANSGGNSGNGLTARERRRLGNSTVVHSSSQDSIGKAGLLGLQNIGNTCFMNSVLQCLSHTKPLREYCLKGWSTDINNNNSRMKGALMKAFSDLLAQLWNPSRATYVIPDQFKAQIQKFAPRFVGYSQQDAQEFLRYVLQGLHEDVNRVRSKAAPLPPIDDNVPDSQKAMESWKRYLRVDDSRIVDIFVGQLKSELKCTSCGHVSTTFDPFWDLSLPIPQSSRLSGLSLYDCLDAFTREETLDGDEKPKCEKCKTRRKCSKKFSIQRFPKMLVLHLKRFSGERFRSRLSTPVEFPLKNFEMKKYSSAQSNPTCSTYSLYAVSNHSGTPLMGHYTAFCSHAISGKWHLYDDGRVSNVENRSVAGSEAYVLFYEQQDGEHEAQVRR